MRLNQKEWDSIESDLEDRKETRHVLVAKQISTGKIIEVYMYAKLKETE